MSGGILMALDEVFKTMPESLLGHQSMVISEFLLCCDAILKRIICIYGFT